jgi:hypothetical protein
LNGAIFRLDKRIGKPDEAMNDEVLGMRLWDELVRLTELELAGEKDSANSGWS